MTPEEFKQAMLEARDRTAGDLEAVHLVMDDLMCDLLKELGYEEGVEVYQQKEKWYA